PAYFQTAPEDQQVDKIVGGEPVILLNLTPDGRRDFRLPIMDVPVVFFRRRGARDEMKGVLDTVLIEPDLGRMNLVWRASLPLPRTIFDVTQILVGTKSRAWWRSIEGSKAYYPSLADMAKRKSDAVENVP